MISDEQKSSLSKSTTLAELAEFWDSHDATEFDDHTHPVEMRFELNQRRHYVAIDPDLLASLRQRAQMRGLSTESLVNLWLQERLLLQTG